MGMFRSAFLIFNQGVEVPTRRLFRVFQPYFMLERLARITRAYHKGNTVSVAALKAARNATSRKLPETLFKALWDMR
ncbi:hypothetical protein HFV01_05625 [Limnospira fusiformis SAG 85.79]|uniref:Uncharacterized protein n=1 Tax=Limnospira indica PCC 8005 TaxID=376219 RepID=A0A9P1KJP2_9CYAN|nr:hypothetical protein HFV01_05625 [Limnospira fusiformis SAG 85.79]RAQ39241.1 hypothetical protein B9S53_22865 [Arthrospira sp. O9.13F]CDM96865.1 protein of unknown function [Limnospira indica PCC 8005]